MKRGRLSLLEAASIVTGLGVGGGIMAVPYLASLSGPATVAAVLVVAYGVSVLFNLMVAEVAVRERGRQLVEVLARHVFAGRVGRLLLWPFFAAIVVTFFLVLSGFLVGCAQILADLLGLPVWLGTLVTYVAAAGVVLMGLRAVGLVEKVAVLGMAAIFAVLAVASLLRPANPLPPLAFGGWKEALALYGMVMFGFTCFWSVPQAAEGLGYDRRVPWAVALGIGVNLLFVFVVTAMTLRVADGIGDIAILDWSGALGRWAIVLGGASVFLAMITSYWSNAYALAVVLQERLGWTYRRAWVFATVPSLFLALVALGRLGFLGFMRLAGGAVAVLLTVLIVPAYRGSRRTGGGTGESFSLGRWGGPVFQALVVVAYLLMAVGSLVPVG